MTTSRSKDGALRKAAHPFVQNFSMSTLQDCSSLCHITGAAFALISEHVVQHRIVFPAAAYLEQARAAASVATTTWNPNVNWLRKNSVFLVAILWGIGQKRG